MSEEQISSKELYKLLQTVTKQNNEILRQNNEIKEETSTIRRQLAVQEGLISEVKTQNAELKLKNDKLEKRVITLERQLRENNLLLFNIKEDDNVTLKDLITDFLNRTVNVKLDSRDVVNIYRLGKGREDSDRIRPIILKLSNNFKKREILSNVKRLKGTGVGVSEDLPEEEREGRKLVYENYRSAKQRGYSAKLIGNKVVINGQIYTSSQLTKTGTTKGEEHILASENQQGKSVSAPTSPVFLHDADGVVSSCPNSESLVFTEIGSKQRVNTESTVADQQRFLGNCGTIPKQKKIGIETRARSNSKSSAKK